MLSIAFMSTALTVNSIVTNLTVEGIKRLANNREMKISSTALAAIISVIMAALVCTVYMILNDIVFTAKIGVEIIVLMYLSFLVSTVGYDKVIQALGKVTLKKEGK